MASFEAMLTSLQNIRQMDSDAFRARQEKILAISDRLYDIFNDKSAQYLIPPIRKQSRLALDKVQRDATDLAREITVSMIRNEYNADELSALVLATREAVTSPIGPGLNEILDARMAGVAGVLLHSLQVAFEDAQKAEQPVQDQKEEKLQDLEKEAFIQFLKEDTQASAVMKKMVSGQYFRGISAEEATQDLGMLVTDGYMRSLQVQLDEILQESGGVLNMWIRKRDVSDDENTEKLVTFYQLTGPCYTMTREFFEMPEAKPAQKSAPKTMWYGG